MTSTNSASAHLPVPLGESDRTTVLARLDALPANIRGKDVSRLIDYVELALKRVDDRFKPLGEDAVNRAAIEPDVDRIAAVLPRLIAAAKELARQLSLSRDTAATDDGTDHARFNPLAAAVARFGQPRGGVVRLPRARELQRVVEALAALNEKSINDARGNKYDRGSASGLVRAVAVYAQEEGFFARDWGTVGNAGGTGQRGGKMERLGDRLTTPSLTTELIVQCARAFGLSADASQLRTAFNNYVSELRALGRRNPSDVDLYGRWFDNKPTRKPRRK